MSNVVEFLRPDILRILINRNIVQVPKVSYKGDDRLFHACLLGDCGKFDSSCAVSRRTFLVTYRLFIYLLSD
jgi:hypothetical protein